jgi:hypothetical protein
MRIVIWKNHRNAGFYGCYGEIRTVIRQEEDKDYKEGKL